MYLLFQCTSICEDIVTEFGNAELVAQDAEERERKDGDEEEKKIDGYSVQQVEV